MHITLSYESARDAGHFGDARVSHAYAFETPTETAKALAVMGTYQAFFGEEDGSVCPAGMGTAPTVLSASELEDVADRMLEGVYTFRHGEEGRYLSNGASRALWGMAFVINYDGAMSTAVRQKQVPLAYATVGYSAYDIVHTLGKGLESADTAARRTYQSYHSIGKRAINLLKGLPSGVEVLKAPEKSDETATVSVITSKLRGLEYIN